MRCASQQRKDFTSGVYEKGAIYFSGPKQRKAYKKKGTIYISEPKSPKGTIIRHGTIIRLLPVIPSRWRGHPHSKTRRSHNKSCRSSLARANSWMGAVLKVTVWADRVTPSGKINPRRLEALPRCLLFGSHCGASRSPVHTFWHRFVWRWRLRSAMTLRFG